MYNLYFTKDTDKPKTTLTVWAIRVLKIFSKI